ncbi:hypothetical protein FWG76_02315 [Candidatus Saccharibacteria bacterium]|nr:hypothetical protein [Candidatus Saccharibacteria bacterium]
MKKVVLGAAMACLLALTSASAFASPGALKMASVKQCASNGVFYGHHSKDNHWHVAVPTGNGRWNASGDVLGYSDPCPPSQNNASSPSGNTQSGSSNNSTGGSNNQQNTNTQGGGSSDKPNFNSSTSGSNNQQNSNTQSGGSSSVQNPSSATNNNNQQNSNSDIGNSVNNDGPQTEEPTEENTEPEYTEYQPKAKGGDDIASTVVGVAVLGGAGFGTYKLVEQNQNKQKNQKR